MVKENNGAESSTESARELLDKAALARDKATVGVADAVNSGVEAAQKAKAMLDEKAAARIPSPACGGRARNSSRRDRTRYFSVEAGAGASSSCWASGSKNSPAAASASAAASWSS